MQCRCAVTVTRAAVRRGPPAPLAGDKGVTATRLQVSFITARPDFSDYFQSKAQLELAAVLV